MRNSLEATALAAVGKWCVKYIVCVCSKLMMTKMTKTMRTLLVESNEKCKVCGLAWYVCYGHASRPR